MLIWVFGFKKVKVFSYEYIVVLLIYIKFILRYNKFLLIYIKFFLVFYYFCGRFFEYSFVNNEVNNE